MATTRKSSLAAAMKKKNRPLVSIEQEVLLSILRTASEASHAADKFLRDYGITQSQYSVLRILREAEAGRLCSNGVSARVVAEVPDMPRLLDRIEKAGWITRERDKKDRRQVFTIITDSGKKLVTEIEGPFHEEMHRLFEGIKATDLKLVLNVLTQIRIRRSELS
jgi:DNA-binding MarR family transcriptional regulator